MDALFSSESAYCIFIAQREKLLAAVRAIAISTSQDKDIQTLAQEIFQFFSNKGLY